MKIYTQSEAEGINEQHFQFDNSFGSFIRFLEKKQQRSNDIRERFYRYLIKKFNQQPQFLVPFKQVNELEQHDDLVQLLRMSLLPLTADTSGIPMALAFLQPSSLFYYTNSFKTTFTDEHVEFNTKEDTISNLRYFVKLVLERCYNVKTDAAVKIVKQVVNREKHIIRHHQLNVDSRFIDVHTSDVLPPFNEEWLKLLAIEGEEFTELFNHFPSQQFRLEGFCMLTAEDISSEVAINQLKNAVLNMHAADLNDTLDKVELAIGELMNDSRIKIGVTPFFKINGQIVYDRSFITKCVGISTENNILLKGITIEDIYKKFSLSPQPYIFSNIDEDFVASKPYLCGLLDENIKSFMAYPIYTRDGLIGVFELGAPEKNDINSNTLNCLQAAFPLITDLINYMIETFDNKIERLVKEKFTPLQESVEWKFHEVAWQYLVHETEGKNSDAIGTVAFNEVHPLYGAIDIRNSSVERNTASRKDYLNQLNATLELLEETSSKQSLPLLDSIQYKCESFLTSLKDLLTSEDELNIKEFLEQEVYVLFKHVANIRLDMATRVKEYLDKTDYDTGEFHQYHKAYEESVNRINKHMVKFFEEEAEKLQSVYPFYFEKYRTDGVEYNIYIGQSVVPGKPFNTIYLKNLRAWQVSSMAHIARLNYQLYPTLPLPLQTTQLILVNGSTIDISFRKDERRFDVEGAYNIRYEILKKRIDKARIKGTLERLTQPDKIAIVYSNSSEIIEYTQHINYLQNKGVLTDTLETLELENLQGISGLKALRVGIKYMHTNKESLVTESIAVV